VTARGTQPPTASTEEAINLLATGELRLLGLMPRASNYTFLAEAEKDGRIALAVYKPRDGEAPLWDFPEGTLCRREVAAFVLAESLGWPAIPPTVLRDGPHGLGSVQLFVEASPREHFFTLRGRRLNEFRPVAAFDAVANNADRKGGHCLLAPDGVIWSVDHGVCFAAEPKLRTVIWDFAGQPIPPNLLSDLGRVCVEVRSGGLRQRLLALLSPEEVDVLAGRIQAVVRSGQFPKPGPDRPYPWPPV
jgi:uncharacterized repeat protein (TIGR03843 family)